MRSTNHYAKITVGYNFVSEVDNLFLSQWESSFLESARSYSLSENLFLLVNNDYLFFRVSKQLLREAKLQAVDYLILLLAGACLGSLSKVKGDTFGYRGYMYTIIAMCKCTCSILYYHWARTRINKFNLLPDFAFFPG